MSTREGIVTAALPASPVPRSYKRGITFGVLFVIESLVFAILTLAPYLPSRALLYAHAGLTAALLAATWILKRSKNGRGLWPVCYALFVAAAAGLDDDSVRPTPGGLPEQMDFSLEQWPLLLMP